MPKIVDHDAYREELLEQCFRLFAEYGYSSLSLRALASELGVSTGTIYHYFESKDAIFVQLVDLIVSRVVVEGSATVAQSTGTDGQIRAVVRFVHGAADVFVNILKIAVDSTRMSREHGVSQTLAEAVERLQVTIGEVVDGIDERDATFIFDALTGLIARRMLCVASGLPHEDLLQWKATEEQLVKSLR